MVESIAAKPFGADSGLQAYPVWDRTVRWFHWINVACVFGLLAIGSFIYFEKEIGISDEGQILLKTIHVSIGYVFLTNLVWRLVWAFIGGPFARWRRLLPFRRGYGRAYREYLSGFRQGDPPPYAGHNPVARLSVTLLLALMISQASTGLVSAMFTGRKVFHRRPLDLDDDQAW